MSVATLTSKGQITLPQSVRTSLGVQAGDKLDFVADDAGGFRVVALRKDVHALRGRFAGRVAKPASVQDMNDAVQTEAVARARPLRSPPRAATK
jgi:antitoxin PrlF